MRKTELFAAIAAVLIASPVMAQGRGRGNGNGGVPPGQRPSAGMCRIWIDGVPPGQQPAQTDCATAAARVPANGRVIYGDRTNNNLRGVYDPNNRGTYDPNNRGTYDPNNRGVYDPNGQVARQNGRDCIQRADQNGVLRNYCTDARTDRRGAKHDDDDDDRNGNNNRFDRQDDRKDGKGKYKKAKKGKGHGHDDN